MKADPWKPNQTRGLAEFIAKYIKRTVNIEQSGKLTKAGVL